MVQGSILAIAGVITKIIGAVYRIPLMNIVGDEGMGYYNVAFFHLHSGPYPYFLQPAAGSVQTGVRAYCGRTVSKCL